MLTSIAENIQSLLDQGQYVCGIFVDLEKALDTVGHEILFEKLNHYGVHGNVNKLIKSYLANRKHYVSLDLIPKKRLLTAVYLKTPPWDLFYF